MKKPLLVASALLLSLMSMTANAQTPSLKNSTWKLYVQELNDTITLHIKMDSSYVTVSTGDAVVKSVCKISADTLSFTDYDGQYACPSQTGTYKLSFSDDNTVMIMTVIDDPCDGRNGAINKMKWMKAPTPAQK
jgi:hypothetical protein